jgi:hypothetical protein
LTIEFEGRETQTAGSWRISVERQKSQQTLENSAFQAITVMLLRETEEASCCEGARYAEDSLD